MMYRTIFKVFLGIALCAALAGCTVGGYPIKKDELKAANDKDAVAITRDQEEVSGPLTLEEAMARVIKYNLDYRIKLMEEDLSIKQYDLTTYDLLPRLMADTGWTRRDRYNASSSLSVLTLRESLEPSTSQDKSHYNADLVVAWNLLDFGVSYYQTKQQADRFYVSKERRRKALQAIMQQVRLAYWQAVGVQQLEDRFPLLMKQVEAALKESADSEIEKLKAPIEALTYRKTLLDLLRQLESLQDELVQAKPRLAALMNLPPGGQFKLAPPSSMELPQLKAGLESMEQHALLKRPEIMEAHLQERISANETKKAIVRLFPGFELSLGKHYDSNSFLYYDSWVEGGVKITWNLINLMSGKTQYNIARSQEEITKAGTLALNMAVLTQVHVAYRDFESRKRQYTRALEMQDIDMRILEQTQNAVTSGAQNRLNEIRAAAGALMAEYRKYQNYAALQNSYGQMLVTLGYDPVPENIDRKDLKELAGDLRKSTEVMPLLEMPGTLEKK